MNKLDERSLQTIEQEMKELVASGVIHQVARIHKAVFDVYRNMGFSKDEALEMVKFLFVSDSMPGESAFERTAHQ